MNQKNIDVINICLDMMETFGNEKSKADIQEAKEAFQSMAEKQISKRVGIYPSQHVIKHCCPTCGTPVISDHYKYCSECGQAISWEGIIDD